MAGRRHAGLTPDVRGWQYDARLQSDAPVVVTIVRPDADEWPRTDPPLLTPVRVAPFDVD